MTSGWGRRRGINIRGRGGLVRIRRRRWVNIWWGRWIHIRWWRGLFCRAKLVGYKENTAFLR